MPEAPSVHCFNPADRAFHENLELSVDGLSLVGKDDFSIAVKQVVVINQCGHADVQGKPVYLGDVVRLAVENGHIDFVVRHGDYLNAEGATLEGWHLHPYVQVSSGQEQSVGGIRPIIGVSVMTVVDNIYQNLSHYVPENTHYCYRALAGSESGDGANGRRKLLVCPFWQNSTHGVVYCRAAGVSSVDNSSKAYELELAHFGSAERVDEVDTAMLLWDQCKECGISVDCAE